MLDGLFALLLMSTLVRPTPSVMTLGVAYLSFDIFLGDLPGQYFFIAAALCDFSVMMRAALCADDKKSLIVARLMISSMIINAVGFILWWVYLPGYFYDVAMYGYYVAAIIAILKEESHDVGFSVGPSALSFIHRLVYTVNH